MWLLDTMGTSIELTFILTILKLSLLDTPLLRRPLVDQLNLTCEGFTSFIKKILLFIDGWRIWLYILDCNFNS